MVLHNPSNWHYQQKECKEWATEWMEQNLTKIEAKTGDGSISVKISRIGTVDADFVVAQSRGKLKSWITVNRGQDKGDEHDKEGIVLELSGSVSGDADNSLQGSIVIADIEPIKDHYELRGDMAGHRKLIETELVPQIQKALDGLPDLMKAEFGHTIQHKPGEDPSSKFAPAKVYTPAAPAQSSAKASTTTTTHSNSASTVNTTTVTDEEEFVAEAKEMYLTFTDPARLTAFMRAPPKVFEGARKGGKFELFGGNVSGEYLELEEPTKIVQSWRLNQWPQGHYSKLHIEFQQNDERQVTVMKVTWTGVPVGQEEVTKHNWLEYYVRSIKRTFNFGTFL